MEIDFKSGQTTNIQMIQEKIESLKLEYLSDLQNGIVEFIDILFNIINNKINLNLTDCSNLTDLIIPIMNKINIFSGNFMMADISTLTTSLKFQNKID